jgi:hypothetical protein
VDRSGREGTILWAPFRTSDGRDRVLVKWAGYDQFADVDDVEPDDRLTLWEDER